MMKTLLQRLAQLLLVGTIFCGSPIAANPQFGNFKGLVVLVQFPDHTKDRTLPPASYFQTMCEQNIAVYLREQSYGQYNATCHVQEWIMTNNTESYFSEGVFLWKTAEETVDFAIPVLDALDEQGLVDFRDFDSDNDNKLDSVLFLHSGYARERGTNYDCVAGTKDPFLRMQSMATSTSDAPWVSSTNVALDGWAIASAFDTTCSNQPAYMGVMTHEWVHQFGAPDLYDPNKLEGGLGHFDIMSNPFGAVSDRLPGSLSTYSKALIGWLEPKEIKSDGEYRLRASNLYPEAYIISDPFPPGEYLLIENRVLTSFDAQLPGRGGLLIYHVDEEMGCGQECPGWPGLFSWPYDHYKVALLQADGSYDLEKGINTGDGGDYFSHPRELLPGTSGKYPNTDSYQYGELTSTGLSITEISEPGETMTFRVSGLGTVEEASPTIEGKDLPNVEEDSDLSSSATWLSTLSPKVTMICGLAVLLLR